MYATDNANPAEAVGVTPSAATDADLDSSHQAEKHLSDQPEAKKPEGAAGSSSEGKDEAKAAETAKEEAAAAGSGQGTPQKDQKAAADEGQTATTVPDSGSKDLVPANETPEKPKKPKMNDWADDDSDYDEEEEFNYNKQPDNDEGPCEDDYIKAGTSPYKSRDAQRARAKMTYPSNNEQSNPGDDLQFLTAEINRSNEDGPSRSGKDESKEAELKEATDDS